MKTIKDVLIKVHNTLRLDKDYLCNVLKDIYKEGNIDFELYTNTKVYMFANKPTPYLHVELYNYSYYNKDTNYCWWVYFIKGDSNNKKDLDTIRLDAIWLETIEEKKKFINILINQLDKEDSK